MLPGPNFALAAALISLPLLAAPSLAVADEANVGAVFPTMGADGNGSQLGAQLMLMSADGGGGTLKRLDVSGQLVNDEGVGGYAAIAASVVEDVSVLGSLDVGAIYRIPSGRGAVTLRGGLVLPTNTADDFSELFTHLLVTAYARPSDYLTAVPDTTSLRLAIAPSIARGSFIARGDLGLDVTLDLDESHGAFLHADVGVGIQSHHGAAHVELGTMAYLEDDEEILHVVAITGEIYAGKTTPYVTLSVPFQTGGEDDEGSFFGADITNIAVGLRGQL